MALALAKLILMEFMCTVLASHAGLHGSMCGLKQIGLQENLYLYHSPTKPGIAICPCGSSSIQPVPSFVSSDYYCEPGCPGLFNISTIYYDDILWDGQQ